MVVAESLVESVSTILCVTEKNEDGLGGKADRGWRKEKEGPFPNRDVGSPGSWRCVGRSVPYKEVAVEQRICL